MARSKTNYIILHCAATRPSMDTIGAAEITKWHREQGYTDIGYHFVIKRNGKVEPGRGLEEIGAHTKGYNAESIGICLVGGVAQHDVTIPENNFTVPQWASLKKLVLEMKAKYPQAKVKGHRDFANKACPSFDVAEWLESENIPT